MVMVASVFGLEGIQVAQRVHRLVSLASRGGVGLLVASVPALSGCSSESPGTKVAASSWCLVGASSRADLLAPTDAEANALVALRWTSPSSGQVEMICSGVVVGSSSVPQRQHVGRWISSASATAARR
jgi:hypothetical protein